MPAYAYLRKSVMHDMANPGASPAFQEEAVRRLAAVRGDDKGLVILSDWDKSGRLGADKRPGYRALLNAIESGAATAVYSYSLSRLARSVSELSRLMADCAKRGIPVRLDADKIDTSTASGMLTAHVLAAVAQFEADVASERVRAAIAVKVANGERVGTVAFYGDREGDDCAAVLAAFREAGSYSGAARLLNEHGIAPRTAKARPGQDRALWWPSSVAVVVQRLDPTIRSAGRGARVGGGDFLLGRLLRCPSCGTSLTGVRDRGGKRVRYSCRLGSVTPHPRTSVSEHLILPTFVEEADRLVALDVTGTIEADGRKRAELEARRLRVVDMYEVGDLNRATYRERMERIGEEMARLDDRQSTLVLPEGIDWTKPPKVVNAALRALWRSVTLDPETFQPVEFTWTMPEWRGK